MPKNNIENIYVIRVPKWAITEGRDGYPRLNLTWLFDVASHYQDFMPVSGDISPDWEVPENCDITETGKTVPSPEQWVFNDTARSVQAGRVKLVFKGRLQYGLLKYAAQGGTSIQEAWEKVWEYASLAEWRTIRDTALPVNSKLSECGILWKVDVNTQSIKIHLP